MCGRAGIPTVGGMSTDIAIEASGFSERPVLHLAVVGVVVGIALAITFISQRRSR